MNLNVLLVDDSAVMRKMIARALKEGGLAIGEIVEADNGKNGVIQAKYREKELSLILSDINMPEMGGIDFVREVRKIPFLIRTPVIMITTEARVETIATAKDAGANGYITKPFTSERIREKVLEVFKELGVKECPISRS
jgi:two-component system chemotaxis response regulator CheY